VLHRVLVPVAVVLGALIALLLLARSFGLLRTFRIISSSMEPTLRCAGGVGCTAAHDDRIITLRYLGISPKRGDVVVVEAPPLAALRCGSSGRFIKRVVGLPGETWAERSGYVYIDGRRLGESYVPASERDARTIAPARIPSGNFLLLGDNRSSSCDSRAWGTVRKKALLGKVVATYWPPGRIGIR
jgi:signal peptidase I